MRLAGGGGEVVDIDDALWAAGGEVGPVHRQRRAADTTIVNHFGAAHRRPTLSNKVPVRERSRRSWNFQEVQTILIDENSDTDVLSDLELDPAFSSMRRSYKASHQVGKFARFFKFKKQNIIPWEFL